MNGNIGLALARQFIIVMPGGGSVGAQCEPLPPRNQLMPRNAIAVRIKPVRPGHTMYAWLAARGYALRGNVGLHGGLVSTSAPAPA